MSKARISQFSKAGLSVALLWLCASAPAYADQASGPETSRAKAIANAVDGARECSAALSSDGFDSEALSDRGWTALFESDDDDEVLYGSKDRTNSASIVAPSSRGEIPISCIVSGRLMDDRFLTDLTEAFGTSLATSDDLSNQENLRIDGNVAVIETTTRTNQTGSRRFYEVMVYPAGETE